MTKVTALKALVHPLVVMQMSEQYSRTKVQQGPTEDKVFGAILGRQNGRQVEAINSFPFKMYAEESGVTFNEAHMMSRAQQYMEVFPELQVIGAYCSGETDEFTAEDKALLIRLALSMRGVEKATHIDSPLFLKLNAVTAGTSRNLPLFAFEGDVVDIDRYNSIEWVLVSEDSERIGVNHIAKLSTKDGNDEGTDSQKQSKAQQSALSMLLNRVELIVSYLEKVQNEELPADFEILKEANLLAQRLKTLDRYATELNEDFEKEDKNIALVSLLPKMTTLLGNMTQVWAKVSMARHDTVSDEGYSFKSGPSFGFMRDPKNTRMSKFLAGRGPVDLDEDCMDEEELDSEMGGPRRKIHAADSQGGVSRLRRKMQKIRGSNDNTRTQPSTSSNVVSTDHEMEPASSGWGHDDFRVHSSPHYVPDAPMPSASNGHSEEHVEEPQ